MNKNKRLFYKHDSGRFMVGLNSLSLYDFFHKQTHAPNRSPLLGLLDSESKQKLCRKEMAGAYMCPLDTFSRCAGVPGRRSRRARERLPQAH